MIDICETLNKCWETVSEISFRERERIPEYAKDLESGESGNSKGHSKGREILTIGLTRTSHDRVISMLMISVEAERIRRWIRERTRDWFTKAAR